MATRALSRAIRLLLVTFALLAPLSCEGEGAREEASGGGETHFLKRCDPSAAACGTELACLCGVCSRACTPQNSCGELAAATCVDECGGRCDATCDDDDDCAAISDAHRCQQGVCRAGEPRCEDDGIVANQVLLIGDSFFALSHQIAAYLEDHARNAGAIGAGERYRDSSRLVGNALAFSGNGIADQYTSAHDDDAEIRVVIMNGGGADALVDACDVPVAECPLLVDAAKAAADLLSRMAADGVTQVVYVYYPNPQRSDVLERIDALRPMIQDACEASPVPCRFLDLRPVFDGHYAEYVIQADGLNPTAEGSRATAAAIWEAMQELCVAQ